jgi:predicted  nucleic acid-binding Zn-ribbon protein
MRLVIFTMGLLGLAACQTTTDPAEGGFISGVSGISSGAYQARIDEREAAVASEQARKAELEAELAGLQSQYSKTKLELVQLRSRIARQGKSVSPSLDRRVNAAIEAKPGGSDDAARIASLRKAIADAKALSDELGKLSA